MMIASTCGDDLRGEGMASGQIRSRWQVMNNACECSSSTETPETSGTAQGGDTGAAGANRQLCRSKTAAGSRCLARRLPSTTRRMSSTATRTRVKRERWRQSWQVAFSKQRDRPIRCHAIMTRYVRGANQGRNSSAPDSAPVVCSAHSGGVLFTSSLFWSNRWEYIA